MTQEKKDHDDALRRQQQEQQAESEAARLAAIERNQPHDIAQRARAQRQAKGMHQKDGK